MTGNQAHHGKRFFLAGFSIMQARSDSTSIVILKMLVSSEPASVANASNVRSVRLKMDVIQGPICNVRLILH